MEVTGIVSIIVAAVAALSAYASQRAAARASIVNTNTLTQADALKESYERARKFDTETIERQDREIDELRRDLGAANGIINKQDGEIRRLKMRVRNLELYGYGQGLKREDANEDDQK